MLFPKLLSSKSLERINTSSANSCPKLVKLHRFSCHPIMDNNKVWETIRHYDWDILLLSMHHSSTDIPIQWVKSFLHSMAEIQTSLDLEFCIDKATKMVYSSYHFGGVSYASYLSCSRWSSCLNSASKIFHYNACIFGAFHLLACLWKHKWG